MALQRLILALIVLLSGSLTLAQESRFQIHRVKTITANVDRFLDGNDNAFATIFCRSDAASVMIVDGGVLDGQNFFFPNTATCEQAKLDAKRLSQKCKIELVVNSNVKSAEVINQGCKQ